MPAPAQLTFMSNLLTSKIFLAQLATLIATIANAAGIRILDDPATQQTLITVLDLGATALLRWLYPTGPVSLSGPMSAPAPKDVPAGTSVVTVVPPDEPQAATTAPAVQPLSAGETHTVHLTPPLAVGSAVPADVLVSTRVGG